MGFSCLPPEGAFYLLMKSPLEDTEAFQKMAEEEHIIIVPTDGFGLPGYFRLSYCIPYESIESSLAAFRALREKVKHRKETDAEQKDEIEHAPAKLALKQCGSINGARSRSPRSGTNFKLRFTRFQ